MRSETGPVSFAVVVIGAGLLVVGLSGHAPPPWSPPPVPPTAAVDAGGAGGKSGPVTRSRHGPKPMSRSVPVAVSIPAVGVNAQVIPLGLNADGSVAVPPLSRPFLTSWYDRGPAPGQPGAAVLLGHVDAAGVGPAVFYRLGDLVAGDAIDVTRSDGRIAVFRVTSVGLYSENAFPAGRVYADTRTPSLRLITCGGTFDWNTHLYLDRTIVWATFTGQHLSQNKHWYSRPARPARPSTCPSVHLHGRLRPGCSGCRRGLWDYRGLVRGWLQDCVLGVPVFRCAMRAMIGGPAAAWGLAWHDCGMLTLSNCSRSVSRILLAAGALSAIACCLAGGPRAMAAAPRGQHAQPVARPLGWTLSIPNIGVTAPVLKLAGPRVGPISVPSFAQVWDVGWYRYGAVPGNQGNALLLGHVDTYLGPAIFYDLYTLRPGDQISVNLGHGDIRRFEVHWVKEVLKTHFPASRVLGSTDGRHLWLVTCGGAFDYTTRRYLSNIVVYTTLIQHRHQHRHQHPHLRPHPHPHPQPRTWTWRGR